MEFASELYPPDSVVVRGQQSQANESVILLGLCRMRSQTADLHFLQNKDALGCPLKKIIYIIYII